MWVVIVRRSVGLVCCEWGWCFFGRVWCVSVSIEGKGCIVVDVGLVVGVIDVGGVGGGVNILEVVGVVDFDVIFFVGVGWVVKEGFGFKEIGFIFVICGGEKS